MTFQGGIKNFQPHLSWVEWSNYQPTHFLANDQPKYQILICHNCGELDRYLILLPQTCGQLRHILVMENSFCAFQQLYNDDCEESVFCSFLAKYLLMRLDTIFDLIYFIQKTARINQSSEIILKVTSVDHFQTNGNSKTLFRAHHECEQKSLVFLQNKGGCINILLRQKLIKFSQQVAVKTFKVLLQTSRH